MNKLFILIFLIVSSYCIKGQDSLKIYIVGLFKNETFKIYYDSTIYIIRAENARRVINATQAFTFKVPMPKYSIDSAFLNMVIFRKSNHGIFYKNTKLYVRKDSLDFLIITRNFRQRDRYPLSYYWTCKPPNYIGIIDEYWNYENNDWEIKEKVSNKNGIINVYDYIFSCFGFLIGHW